MSNQMQSGDILNYFVAIELLIVAIYKIQIMKIKYLTKETFLNFYLVLFSIREMRITNYDLSAVRKLFQEIYAAVHSRSPFTSLFPHILIEFFFNFFMRFLRTLLHAS